MPVYWPSLRRLLSCGLQEFPLWMPLSSLGQPIAHQWNLEPPLGVTSKGPRTFVGAPAPPPCQITLDFLHPLNLLANCLIACDLDSASEADAGRDSGSSSERKLNEVHPPPSDFQDMNHNPSMMVSYRDLVPMTTLFSTCLPIYKGN